MHTDGAPSLVPGRSHVEFRRDVVSAVVMPDCFDTPAHLLQLLGVCSKPQRDEEFHGNIDVGQSIGLIVDAVTTGLQRLLHLQLRCEGSFIPDPEGFDEAVLDQSLLVQRQVQSKATEVTLCDRHQVLVDSGVKDMGLIFERGGWGA